MRSIWITALFCVALAGPAHAGALAGAIAAISAKITTSALLGVALRLVGSVGLSLIQQRRAKKARKKSGEIGLQVNATTRGGTESETTVIGRYATKGHLSYHNSHGKNNMYYQVVIELGGIPGIDLRRVAIDGVWSDLGSDLHPDYGRPILAKRDGLVDHAWLRFHDGTQALADPVLVAKYAVREDIPWSADHIGTGIPYAIVTMKVSSKVFPNGASDLRFEVDGVPLYDPRRDSSAGGIGAQRWEDPATWGQTRNPAVMVYNILRGIRITDAWVWGGEAEAEDLPLWNWVPAMDAADLDVGGRPQFEAGLEIRFADDEPNAVIEDLLASCSGQLAEFGGFFYIQLGEPELPVAWVTDDDILTSDDATKDPFPEPLEIYNRITTTYVSPGAIWNAATLDMIRKPEWEAEDGVPRTFALELPAVFSAAQAGQLAEAALSDNRRWRRHAWPLPPDYANLRPLNTIIADSDWNGYEAKLFEVTEVALDLHRLTSVISLRERDPLDFTINPALEIPDIAPRLPGPFPDAASLTGFAARAVTLANADGTMRRVAIEVTWDGDIEGTVSAIVIEAQIAATLEEAWQGPVPDIASGRFLIQPLLPNTVYRLRARPIASNRDGVWTAWVQVTTDDVRFSVEDVSTEFRTRVETAFERHDAVLGEDGVPLAVTDMLNHVRAALGPGLLPNLPPLPDVPGLPGIPPPPDGPVDARVERVERAVDIEMPRNAARDEAIETLAGAVTTSLLKAERLESLVADAGIFVEPESGRVRIEATGFSGEAQFIVDALNAEVTTRVTYAAMNEAIALAQFDPSQIADLQDVFFRLSTVETSADAQAGAITSLTETLTVDGGVVTMATVSGRLDSLEGEIVDKVSVTQFDGLQTTVDEAVQTLSGFDGARFQTLLTSSAVLQEGVDALAELTLAQVLDQHRRDAAQREAVAFARQDMWARADATDEAVAGLRVDLGVTFEDAHALIQQEANVRASETEALGETVDQIAVALNGQAEDVAGVAAALDDTSARVTQAEDGLDAVSRTTRANNVGIGLVAEDAASVDLRALLDDHATRRALRAGVAQVRQDTQAIVEEDRLALARTREELTVAIGQNDAKITETNTALATEAQARAEQVLELDARLTATEAGVDGAASAIGSLSATVTQQGDVITSVAARTTTLETTIDTPTTGLSARLATVEATKVTAAGAVAAVNQTISASYGDLAAMAEATAFAEATADGIASGYVWRLNGENLLEAVSVADGTGGPVSTFRIAADFVQITGLAQIDTAVLADLAADNAFISNLKVTNANIEGHIQSDNYAQGQSGWIIRQTGEAEFNGPVISRNIIVAEGTVTPGVITVPDNPSQFEWQTRWEQLFVPTGVAVPLRGVWMPSDAVYIARAAFDGEVSALGGITGLDEYWEVTAEVMHAARWLGPQELRLHLQLKSKGVHRFHAPGDTNASGLIRWVVYKIT